MGRPDILLKTPSVRGGAVILELRMNIRRWRLHVKRHWSRFTAEITKHNYSGKDIAVSESTTFVFIVKIVWFAVGNKGDLRLERGKIKNYVLFLKIYGIVKK